ncbi:MAG: bifunctional adenosylcobinamide kinase/adenosylcobinamide-phosphate guanylyltransferase [Hyphomicrobiales bacterium]
MSAMSNSRHILVLGGARSGKSTYAEGLAEGHTGPLVYIATAEPRDGEMSERIAAHVERRGPSWKTVEAPLELASAITQNAADGMFMLVDCITFWLTNVMLNEQDTGVAAAELADVIAKAPGTIVLVSNEVGLGIVPENALARRFRDEAGWVNQKLAAICDKVVFVAAGLPLHLKGKD